MPELPEVETFVRDIASRLARRRFIRARLSHDDVLRGVTRRGLLAGLRGARVTRVFRRAKHAVIVTDRGRLVVQPGMTGSLFVSARSRVRNGAWTSPPTSRLRTPDYSVLRITLSDGRTLIYRDPRRLGTLLWLDEAGWEGYTEALGPEPLDPGFTSSGLGRILAASRSAVKKVLMDQRALAGVGNIYAQEALFAAGIDPSKPAHRVPEASVRMLHRHLRRILTRAVVAQGTTIRDYRTGSGEAGGFQAALRVYGREGAPCLRCGTALAGTHAIDGRITVFCHRCQR
jgi:formamidopyrimidine-DNA glycosylase